MYKGSINLAAELLLGLGFGKQGPVLFETQYDYFRRVYKALSPKRYYDTVYQLQKRGVIAVDNKKGKKFLRLTAKGELELLLKKTVVDSAGPWDGKWRMVIFDIPADRKSNRQRDKLRRLLKQRGFYMVQASVFVHPHPLNREAVRYLKQSGLIKYIRMFRIDEVDDDTYLRKKFKL